MKKFLKWFSSNPGLVTLIATCFLGYLEYKKNDGNWKELVATPVALVITAGAASLKYAIGAAKSGIDTNTSSAATTLRNAIRADLLAYKDPIRIAYLIWLRDELTAEAEECFTQLSDASLHKPLRTKEKCTDELVGLVRTRRFKELKAVCGYKDQTVAWEYFKLNYGLAEYRQVEIQRVFVELYDKKFTPDDRRVIFDHLNRKRERVDARVIFGEDKPLLKGAPIPWGFGFALFGEVGLVHWGFAEDSGDTHDKEHGRVFDNQWLVRKHGDIHDYLWEKGAGGSRKGKTLIWRKLLANGRSPHDKAIIWGAIFEEEPPAEIWKEIAGKTDTNTCRKMVYEELLGACTTDEQRLEKWTRAFGADPCKEVLNLTGWKPATLDDDHKPSWKSNGLKEEIWDRVFGRIAPDRRSSEDLSEKECKFWRH